MTLILNMLGSKYRLGSVTLYTLLLCTFSTRGFIALFILTFSSFTAGSLINLKISPTTLLFGLQPHFHLIIAKYKKGNTKQGCYIPLPLNILGVYLLLSFMNTFFQLHGYFAILS